MRKFDIEISTHFNLHIETRFQITYFFEAHNIQISGTDKIKYFELRINKQKNNEKSTKFAKIKLLNSITSYLTFLSFL